MNLPIRWKLIVLLGALAIVPLLIVAWNDIKTLALLGSRLASQAGQALSDQAREHLERQADDFARLIVLERMALEMLVHLQAREITQRLRNGPASAESALWLSDLSRDAPLPEAKHLPDKYFQQATPRRREPLPVSFARIALHAAPGSDAAEIAAQGARLAGARDFLAAVSPHYTDLVHWYFTALESGLHATYPGHGGYPVQYDPRERAWYRAQRTRRALTWSRPQTDVTSRLTMISATMPLFDAEDRFIGVTGIDVPVTRLLGAVHPSARTGPAGEVLLTVASPGDSPSAKIEILARRSHVERGGDWREESRTEYFTTDRPEIAAEILADMRAGESGFRRLTYHGEEVFCAYRRFDDHATYLVFIVPAATAARPAADAAEYALETTRRQVDALIPLVAITALVTVTAALFGARAVTGPVHRLMDAVGRVAQGDFEVRVRIRSGDELELLGEHFNRMIPQIAAHAQMKQALAIAREVQQRLLPGAAPESATLDIHGICRYAEETGGDYFDYLHGPPTEDGSERAIGVAIGDVSGHGIGSALLMTTARAFLNANDFRADDLPGELAKLNANLADDVHAGRFMTLSAIVFDVTSRTLRWVSAGHDPALFFDASRETFEELAGGDIPLGIDAQWSFGPPGERSFARGDIVVLATDGVWEARAGDGRRFGKERIREHVRAHRQGDARHIAHALVDEVARFRGSEPPHDDMTVVVVKIRT